MLAGLCLFVYIYIFYVYIYIYDFVLLYYLYVGFMKADALLKTYNSVRYVGGTALLFLLDSSVIVAMYDCSVCVPYA